MSKNRLFAVLLLMVLVGIGYFNYTSEFKKDSFFSRPFRLGLDLNGGTELVYKADVSRVAPEAIGDSLSTLRDVIEKRVNLFGVSEPIVQVENAGLLTGTQEHRLVVDLPGVTDIDKAVALIGETPTLDFKLEKDNFQDLLKQLQTASSTSTTTPDDLFIPTKITGRLLDKAVLDFDLTTGAPIVSLVFNAEGRDLFDQITKDNVGKVLSIFLDGRVIESPVIKEEIKEGKAQITGGFTPQQAKDLVRNLNYGALPVPIQLVGTETVGASLGQEAKAAGVKAGIVGFLLVVAFLILWYRLPGLVASLSLVMYIMISLALFKLIPVTLTAAGIAGFILSIGMAVDANILIFERMKEELRKGRVLDDAMREGFHRAWLSIRDSNISSIITAIVLFWLGTSAVKGFALTLGLGVVVSMFTAITVSRTLLFALNFKGENRFIRFLFSSGFNQG